jgi:hypothetical protein
LLRRARITRRPVWDLMRARKPDVLLRLRLVPPKVRLVMETHLANLKKVTVLDNSIANADRAKKPGFFEKPGF